MSLSRKTREKLGPVLNAGKGAAGGKRGKLCHQAGGKRGKNVCPASHAGKHERSYLRKLWVKMLNQAFYRVMSDMN